MGHPQPAPLWSLCASKPQHGICRLFAEVGTHYCAPHNGSVLFWRKVLYIGFCFLTGCIVILWAECPLLPYQEANCVGVGVMQTCSEGNIVCVTLIERMVKYQRWWHSRLKHLVALSGETRDI